MLERLDVVLGGCVGEGTQDSDRIVAYCYYAARLYASPACDDSAAETASTAIVALYKGKV